MQFNISAFYWLEQGIKVSNANVSQDSASARAWVDGRVRTSALLLSICRLNIRGTHRESPWVSSGACSLN